MCGAFCQKGEYLLMKVLLINGSPHEKGCTYTALSLIAGELNASGIETEILNVGTKPVGGCIGCGGCTATCTAGNLTDFNFRKLHTLVRRGEYQGVYEQMNKCMLCGKCRLVCPRGINTRAVVMLIKRKLGDF
jgi:heterodisulfide reductase subunit C